MLRSEVNQKILDLYDRPSYLEIGVDAGTTFHAINAARKVAVDPKFWFDINQKKSEYGDGSCDYYEMKSDDYFSSVNKMSEKFDVIFIDGLHTFDQTLRDLLNSVICLKNNGIIIVDDVFPTSYLSSLPDLDLMLRYNASVNSPDMTWMGDVYRLVLFVEQYLPLFSYATVSENHGQMIMWYESRSTIAKQPSNVEEICRAEYIETILRKDLFNIKLFNEIYNYLKLTRRIS